MDTLKRTKEWFELAVPEPELKNFNSQLGCHFEEVGEMLSAIHGNTYVAQFLIGTAKAAIENLSRHIKENSNEAQVAIAKHNQANFLDALCDQTVTATGVAHMMGHDFIGAMSEVNRSNFSKFVDGKPVFNTNAKIIKGKDYTEPNLKPFLKSE
jgi:predicted HAD superfamily Cof-like phosphohydrolase